MKSALTALLTICLCWGVGCSKNLSEFQKTKAKAMLGDDDAQRNLAQRYYYGLGVKKDFKKAAKWQRKAADQGWKVAQHNLGFMYARGLGVQQDFKEAVKWQRKAADQGYKNAQYSLGLAYYYGQGVQQDFKEAVTWYRKAADQGYAKAQYKLGVMYDNGEGVLEDYVTAYAWWNIAAANGSKSAKDNKPKIANDMTPEQIAKAEELLIEMIEKNPKFLRDPKLPKY